MPGIKVVELAGHQPRRRAQLWESFGALLNSVAILWEFSTNLWEKFAHMGCFVGGL